MKPANWLAVCGVLGCCLAATTASPCAAQEFRVYTWVYEVAGSGQRDVVAGKSLSLAHAGKVYDLINNGTETEVIIYEPAHDRFTILNTTRNLATTVHFEEIRQKLDVARQVTEKRIEEFRQMPSHAGAAYIQKLEFVLDPRLERTLDPQAGWLTLASPMLTYRVHGTPVEDNQVVRFYLQYADQVARLNYVLHPGALFPEPRLVLNEHLRQLGWMPLKVELRADPGTPLHLRAEHKIHWQLDAVDRGLIHDWESLLKSRLVRQVPLAEYQRSLLQNSSTQR